MPEKKSYVALIVDDDREMRVSLVGLLEAAGWTAFALSRGTEVAGKIDDVAPDVILSDVRMPGIDGIELLHSLQKIESPPVVLISAHGDIPMAVDAMEAGAYSFVEKPFDPKKLLGLLRAAAEQYSLSRQTERLKKRLGALSGLDRLFIGTTESAAALRREVVEIADTKAPVLLIGETGTGKELIARAIHDLSSRSGQPFEPLNCAILRADHFEDVMLGTKNQPGVLFAANGGTLFLDELSGWPEEAQALLLRTLDGHEIRTAGNEMRPFDIRVVSAALPALEDELAAGTFRQDLFYRLNTIVLRLPSLRSRRDDIHALFQHFLTHFSALYEVTAPPTTTGDLAALLAHDWPGNVRELRHVAERRILLARRGLGSVAEALHRDEESDTPDALREAVASFEREIIAKAIQAHEGRMDAVSEALGIGRRTLNEKIVKLGINREDLI